MTNKAILIKIKQRVNKLSSDDFDNIPCWQIVEAFNKYQLEWCRRNTHGVNILHEGDEGSTSKIDDLQRLIKPTGVLTFSDKGDYYEGDVAQWPADYLRYKIINLTVVKECCTAPKRMTVWLVEEGNKNVFLDDVNRRPDYAWGQTFATITGNKLNIFHDKEFTISECTLEYYRQPRKIQVVNCQDVFTGTTPTTEVECEFQDDLAELFCDGAAAILDGDIENYPAMQRSDAEAEKSN